MRNRFFGGKFSERPLDRQSPFIVSLSGGKDSMAMAILLIEEGYNVEKIMYFDVGSWGFSATTRAVELFEKKYSRTVERVYPDDPFNYMLLEKPNKARGHVGLGWPSPRYRWCTWQKSRALRKGEVGYRGGSRAIGFSASEPRRLLMIKKYRGPYFFPLANYGLSSDDALKFCYKRGFDFDGLYESFERSGCWCCPLQPLKSLEVMRSDYPDLWQKLMRLNAKCATRFKSNKNPVDDGG